MSNFEKVPVEALQGSAYTLFNNGWALLTAGDMADFNTMTISWGELGCLWNRPVCTVFVRPCRHTYGYMQKAGSYTVSLFDPDEHRAELTRLGTVSGRDVNKMTDSGLTPVELDGLPAFAEARAVLVVDKLYDCQFEASRLPAEIKQNNYAGVADDDLHRIYFGKITAVYMKK